MRREREARRLGVTSEVARRDGRAVDRTREGAAKRCIGERRALCVEAEVDHVCRRVVGERRVRAAQIARAARQVSREQMHLARGEKVRRRVRVLDGAQLDTLERQRAVAAPVGVLLEACAVAVRDEEIRPRAERHGVLLRTGFDDGDVKQRGERAVRAREIDNERAVACAHRGDVGKARAVALALLRAAKRREHIACRQDAAVGKADAVAEVKGVARAVVVVLIAAAQHILRRKRLVQHEKPLVEQRAKRLLHAVGAGDGVERHALQIRQCERRDRRQGGGGVRFHRRRFLPEVAAAVVAHIAAPAARKRKRERQRAQKRREAALHSASSVRQIIAAMPPRRSPIARCDQ